MVYIECIYIYIYVYVMYTVMYYVSLVYRRDLHIGDFPDVRRLEESLVAAKVPQDVQQKQIWKLSGACILGSARGSVSGGFVPTGCASMMYQMTGEKVIAVMDALEAETWYRDHLENTGGDRQSPVSTKDGCFWGSSSGITHKKYHWHIRNPASLITIIDSFF